LLVLPYTILPEGLNCLFVSPYMKMLRHYLPKPGSRHLTISQIEFWDEPGEGGSRLVRLQWFCPSFFLTHRT
jgi:hypothetical protein